MRHFLLFFAFMLCLSATCAYGQTVVSSTLSAGDLRDGDLLFAVNEEGNAITASTSSGRDLPIDHVGIFFRDGGKSCVVEASARRGVAVTDLAAFLADNHLCVVGRVDSLLADASVSNALRYRGLPYDSLFEADDSAMYCSELVQKSFVDSLGHHVFTTIPMSFHDSTGTVLPFWTDFYRRHGRTVPEGEPGTNPGQLARSPKTKIIGWMKG